MHIVVGKQRGEKHAVYLQGESCSYTQGYSETRSDIRPSGGLEKLPNSDKKTEDLSKILQGPDEPYQDFVARLLEVIGKVIGDEQAGMVLAKQLAYENANSACQAALRPYRKKEAYPIMYRFVLILALRTFKA